MVAVPEVCASAPITKAGPAQLSVLAHCHRAVAVVDSAAELLRPGSDLLRIVSGIGEVDVLVVLDEDPLADAAADESDVDDRPEAFRAELRAEVARLGRPELRVHQLGLPAPLTAADEPDLVAALSELVGFDPEPGVYFLAPAPAPADPGRSVISGAARRIAQVYGLPLVRYRCLELAVVPDQRGAGEG